MKILGKIANFFGIFYTNIGHNLVQLHEFQNTYGTKTSMLALPKNVQLNLLKLFEMVVLDILYMKVIYPLAVVMFSPS